MPRLSGTRRDRSHPFVGLMLREHAKVVDGPSTPLFYARRRPKLYLSRERNGTFDAVCATARTRPHSRAPDPGAGGLEEDSLVMAQLRSNKARITAAATVAAAAALVGGLTALPAQADTATNTLSGTSMATPHVAGAAAVYLAGHTSATPAQAATALVNGATSNVVTSPGTGLPNKLLKIVP